MSADLRSFWASPASSMFMRSRSAERPAGASPICLYAGMLRTIAAGLWAAESVEGVSTVFGWVYNFMMVPLQAPCSQSRLLYCLGRHRSFHYKQEAAVLLVAALIVMMGRWVNI